MTGADEQPSLYERLGGDAFFNLLVTAVFDEKLEHPVLKQFFQNIPVSALKTHQIKLFRSIFGKESDKPTDEDLLDFMIRTHTHMFRDQGLNETHYDMAADCFAQGLQTFQVDQGLIDECMAILASMRVVFEYGAQVAEREKTMDKEKMKTLPLASPKTIGTDLEVVLPEYSKIEIPTWLTEKLAKDSKTPVLRAWTCDLTNRFGPEGDKDIADTFMDQPYMDHHVYLVAFLQLAFMKADNVCPQHQRKMLQIVQYPRGRENPKLSQELYIRMIAQFLIASVKLGLSQEALKKAEKQLRSHASSFAKKTTPVGGVKAPHILHKIRMLEDKDNLTALGIRENTSSTSPSLLVGGCDETSADLSTESNHSSSLFGKPSHQGDDEKKHKKMHAKEKPKRSSSSNPFAWLKGTIWASKPKNHTPGAVSA